MPRKSYMPPENSMTVYTELRDKKKDLTNRDIVYNTMLVKMRNKMGSATDIAMHCQLDYHEVGRRMNELVKENRIYVYSENGGRTLSNKACRIYKVVEAVQNAPAANAANTERPAAGTAAGRQGSIF